MDAGALATLASVEIVGDQFRAFATATIDSLQTQSLLTDGGEHYKSALPPSYYFRRRGKWCYSDCYSLAGIVTGISITSGAVVTLAPTVAIDYSPKDSRAEVKSWNSSTRELQVINRTEPSILPRQ